MSCTISWAVSLAEGSLWRGMKWTALENRSTNSQDGSVALRQGETREKIQGYMGPGMVRDRQWLEKIRRSLPRSLVLGADLANGDIQGQHLEPK
jgi:hypothetical protein